MKILINRTDAIGDLLLTVPMARKIKEQFPEAKIYFLIAPRCQDLLLNNPYIDGVLLHDKNLSTNERQQSLEDAFSDIQPTHYFFVGGDQLGSYFAWKKKVPFRGGLISKWQSFLFLNKGIRQKRSRVEMHETEYNLQLLKPLGVNLDQVDLGELATNIYLNESEKNEKQENGKELVFIHPGMTGHTLNWPEDNYIELIVQLNQLYGEKFRYLISFTPSDEPYLKKIRKYFSENSELQEKVTFFNGAEKGLRNYMTSLSQASLFVGPSTGTTHIANALGVKQVGLYSPIKAQSAKRWRPLKPDKAIILSPDLSEEELRACPPPECMAKIEVQHVLRATQRLLERE